MGRARLVCLPQNTFFLCSFDILVCRCFVTTTTEKITALGVASYSAATQTLQPTAHQCGRSLFVRFKDNILVCFFTFNLTFLCVWDVQLLLGGSVGDICGVGLVCEVNDDDDDRRFD